MSKAQEKPRTDIYARITEKIVAALEKGVRPWVQPWRSGNATGRVTRPVRHNGLPYSGMNVLLLWSAAIERGFTSPMWMTFKQCVELGGAVRKGETGTMVVFASRFTKTEIDAGGEEFGDTARFARQTTLSQTNQERRGLLFGKGAIQRRSMNPEHLGSFSGGGSFGDEALRERNLVRGQFRRATEADTALFCCNAARTRSLVDQFALELSDPGKDREHHAAGRRRGVGPGFMQ